MLGLEEDMNRTTSFSLRVTPEELTAIHSAARTLVIGASALAELAALDASLRLGFDVGRPDILPAKEALREVPRARRHGPVAASERMTVSFSRPVRELVARVSAHLDMSTGSFVVGSLMAIVRDWRAAFPELEAVPLPKEYLT
jgi:hypothetical protein